MPAPKAIGNIPGKVFRRESGHLLEILNEVGLIVVILVHIALDTGVGRARDELFVQASKTEDAGQGLGRHPDLGPKKKLQVPFIVSGGVFQFRDRGEALPPF